MNEEHEQKAAARVTCTFHWSGADLVLCNPPLDSSISGSFTIEKLWKRCHKYEYQN